MTSAALPDPLTAVLATYRLPEKTDFDNAWVGMEPTFQTKKSIRKWAKLAGSTEGEDAFFNDPYVLRTQKDVAKAIARKYARWRKRGRACCPFADVKRDDDLDQWRVRRQNLHFFWPDSNLEPFEVRFALDPETFEYSIKPVPLTWFYDPRFVEFLEEFVWRVPMELGLQPSIAHGGAQFSLSAKTFLGGSLLADVIAAKLNHPELATWIMDWPNCDDRSFRATRQRFQAFRDVLDQYWAGAYHPRALGALTVENAYLDRGFDPAASPPAGLMDARGGPVGSPQEVFQTNFAFGRSIRLQAQNVHPGYWQCAHPDEDGYRPDQIMRYSEGNLNRLQIVGEFHVKSGKVLNPERVVDFATPLDVRLLYEECSWENRGQMCRTSARDFVEALLLDVHHAQYLQEHPRVAVAPSLLQDQLLIDAEQTLRKFATKNHLAELRKQAMEANLEMSRRRIKSDWMEPETLFWEAWRVLPVAEKAAIAREAVGNFLELVEQATTVDPRPEFKADPMEWHRHRIHPQLWEALAAEPDVMNGHSGVRREWERWEERRDEYLARRPPFSLAGLTPPWEVRS